MKTLSKFLFAGASFFVSNNLLAQHGNSGSHAQMHVSSSINASTSGKTVRENARINGSINANAHASNNGKNHANENSVLNRTGTTTVKTHTRHTVEAKEDKGEMKDGTKMKTDKMKRMNHKTKKIKKIHTEIDADEKTDK